MLTTNKEYQRQQAPYAKTDRTGKRCWTVVLLIWEDRCGASHEPVRRCTTFRLTNILQVELAVTSTAGFIAFEFGLGRAYLQSDR